MTNNSVPNNPGPNDSGPNDSGPTDSGPANEREDDQHGRVDNRFVLLVSLAALLAASLFAFLMPHMNGDTFMTLAGGRDVVDGKLAEPDDWSFLSEGRVWINQSWLTGLLFYTLWTEVGSLGLLIYKAVMLGLIGATIILSAYQFRAGVNSAVLVAAYILAASADTVSLRANLLGLAMLSILMWLLFISASRPHRIWLAVGLLTLWAQMHGSFIFGIAVLGLWALISMVVPRWRGRPWVEITRRWPLLVAAALAPILAAVTSPFGLTNLMQPFTLMGFFLPERWPLANQEMMPILSVHPEIRTYLALPWYLFMLGAVAGPLVLRWTRPTTDIPKLVDLDASRMTMWLFSLVLAIITVVMTLCARRFLPVCLIACAPLLAFETQWVLSHRRYAWPAVLAVVIAGVIGFLLERGLVAAMMPELIAGSPAPPSVLRLAWGGAALILVLSPKLGFLLVDTFGRHSADPASDSNGLFASLRQGRYRSWSPLVIAVPLLGILSYQLLSLQDFYRSDSPRTRNRDMFGRMVVMGSFPEDGAEFLKQNQITGQTLNEWQWEGYLHWTNPQLKLMAGGRSRQVYSPRAALLWKTATRPKDYSIHIEQGLQLMVLPASDELARKQFIEPQTPWRIIYYDGVTLIAASQKDPVGSQWLADVQRSSLSYPSERAERYTAAARQLAVVSESQATEIMESVAAAVRLHPTPLLYQLLLAQQKFDRVPAQEIISFFESELGRLHQMDYHRPEGFAYLKSRQLMARSVASYYSESARLEKTPPDKKRILFWRHYARECREAGYALLRGSGDPPIRDIPEQY